MSSSTIIRAFKANPQQMINDAKQLANSSAYAVKKFFYNLVTLGCGKAIEEARADRREKEVVEVATKILEGLQVNHSELTKPANTGKVLYTNMEKKYQIILEDKQLCLYTGTVPYSLFGNSKFEKDPSSRIVLKTISSQNDLDALKKDLATVKEYYLLRSNSNLSEKNKWTLASNLAEAKQKKDELKKEKITNKTDIVFQGNGGKFNPGWEELPKNITGNNYKIEHTKINNENVYNIFKADKPDQIIHIVAGAQSNRTDKVPIDDQINEYFAQDQTKTLEDFLNQPVAVKDSSKYHHLKNAYKQNMAFADIGYLYPLFEQELDKH